MIPQTQSNQLETTNDELLLVSQPLESTNSSNGQSQDRLIAELRDKEYRDAFFESQVDIGIPSQIRSLRQSREWSQETLAEKAGMLQPRISAMEKPGGRKLNLETLFRLASAFDVALQVRFVPFSGLIDWSSRFDPENFKIPTFSEEFGTEDQLSEEAESRKIVNIGHFVAVKDPDVAGPDGSVSTGPKKKPQPEQRWLSFEGTNTQEMYVGR